MSFVATSTTTTTTVTASPFPQSYPPPLGPPNIPLPPLPVNRTRRSRVVQSPAARGTERERETEGERANKGVATGMRRDFSGLPSPVVRRSGFGAEADAHATNNHTTTKTTAPPSLSSIPTKHRPVKPTSSPSIPTLSTIHASPSSAIPTPQIKSLRKTVSIEAFPQPPNRASRMYSLPPSPLSASLSSEALAASSPTADQSRLAVSPRKSGLRNPKLRTSAIGLRQKTSTSSLRASPLLNGAAAAAAAGASDVRPVPGAPGAAAVKFRESVLSLPSPPWSPDSLPPESSSCDGSTAGDGEEDLATSASPDDRGDSALTKDGKGNVIVSVRVRPDAGGGSGEAVDGEWMVDGRRSLVSFKGREGGEYLYDNVFPAHDNNSRVYDAAAKRLVRRVMEGYNGTVFAYGMTGTGKTFSMQGTAASPGVIPLAITDIFSYIRANPNREFLLRVSYLEIYNEKIFDLLTMSSAPNGQQQEEIQLREDSKRGVYATPLKEEIVQSPNQLLRVISKGDRARKVAGTQFNARSSRSHAVVQIVVESRERTTPNAENRRNDVVTPGGVLVSTLSLIDLAGSEKAADSKERRTEGSHINKSLLTLGTVIARLSGDKDSKDGAAEKGQKHLPYRDSKLTRLLQPALSGGSLVSILCTVQLSSGASNAAAALSHMNETLNTLKFASRAKNNIVSHAKRNVSDSAAGVDAGSRALLDRYRLEIAELRQRLEEQTKIKDEPEPEPEPEHESERLAEEQEKWYERQREAEQRHEEQMLEMQLARTALKERISHLNRLILSSRSIGVNSNRVSTVSSFGMSYSNRASMSSATEMADHRRQSALSSVSQNESAFPVSAGSARIGIMPSAATSQIELASNSDDEYAEAESVESVSGRASKDRQIRTLQADLSDKNRYIVTLEKRLIQARCSSKSKSGVALSPQRDTVGPMSPRDVDAIIREKDRELEELRVKLDDQTRMVTALRSAARKRVILESSGFGGEQHPAHRREGYSKRASVGEGQLQHPSNDSSAASIKSGGPRANRDSQLSNGSSVQNFSRHASQLSIGSSVQNFSRHAATPVGVLAKKSEDNVRGGLSGGPRSADGNLDSDQMRKRRTVDEMTRLLDEMIQEKVEGGQVIRGDKGSLRVKRDTLIEEVEQERDALLLEAAEQVARA